MQKILVKNPYQKDIDSIYCKKEGMVYENGGNAPAEFYTYVLEVTYSTGETEPFRGTFTLIR